MPKVLLSGRVTGENDPARESRALLLYLLFSSGWDISNSNGDKAVTLSTIQNQIIDSDAFVFTQGSTLEELFKAVSIFVGYQTLDEKLYAKGMIVLNGDQSWDPFFDVLDHLNSLGTIKQEFRDYIISVNESEEVIGALEGIKSDRFPDPIHHPIDENVDDIYSYEAPPVDGQIGNICVFCSASIEDKDYINEGYELGWNMAKEGFGCVSGAGRTGIMGSVVKGAVEANGWTGGSNVPHIIKLEGLPEGLSSFWLRPDIYTRMEIMIERSDAFVIFPGGAGTVQEFLALLLLLEMGDSLMKGKPIVVYDRIDRSGKNFWGPLINLLKEKGYSDYFTVVKELNMIIPTVIRLMDMKQ